MPNDVPWIYRRLLGRFGPQGWWPVAPRRGAAPVYSPRWTRGRLSPDQQFEVAVGALLTQNTAWSNVEKAMTGLRRAGLTSPRPLLRASMPRLERILRPSGYFRQKSRRLKSFCRSLRARWGSRLDRCLAQPLPEARAELLSFPGFGPETADSVLLYAAGRPVFVVDAYTRRLARRFGLLRTDDYGRVQSFFSGRFPRRTAGLREYHALVVRLAKEFCRAIPVCSPCPLRSRCRAGGGRPS